MKNQIMASRSLTTLLLVSSLALSGCEALSGLMGDSSHHYNDNRVPGSSYQHEGARVSEESGVVKHAASSGSTPAERQSENVPHVRRASSSVPAEAPSLHSVNPAAIPAAPVVVPTTAPVMVAPAVGQ